jgi:hypothetical protein
MNPKTGPLQYLAHLIIWLLKLFKGKGIVIRWICGPWVFACLSFNVAMCPLGRKKKILFRYIGLL